jgi:hypothetical protein
LPKDFADVCEHHHDAPKKGEPEVLQLVRVACSVAEVLGFPAVQCLHQPTYPEATAGLERRLGRKRLPPEVDLRANVTARVASFES